MGGQRRRRSSGTNALRFGLTEMEMWFLVMIASMEPQYVGPMTKDHCQAAAAGLANDGISCMPADLWEGEMRARLDT